MFKDALKKNYFYSVYIQKLQNFTTSYLSFYTHPNILGTSKAWNLSSLLNCSNGAIVE